MTATPAVVDPCSAVSSDDETASSAALLFVALMAWGAFQGTMDVSMNTQAITVERAAKRTLMPGFHGMWSVGSLVGAAIGAGTTMLYAWLFSRATRKT